MSKVKNDGKWKLVFLTVIMMVMRVVIVDGNNRNEGYSIVAEKNYDGM